MLYNIIICDDDSYYLDIITHITNKYFNTKKDFYCKIHSFCDYNSDFLNFIYNSKLPNLIYLLDIETPSGNGFDIARIIKHLDPNIPIVYITGFYDEYKNKALENCHLMEGYVNKFNKTEDELTKRFDRIISLKGKKYIFTIKGNNVKYNINIKNVNCFITGEKNTVTVVGINYPSLYISMKSLHRQLGHQFTRTHQSCIVNFDNVKEFHIKSKVIYFKDGSSINLIARDFITKNKNWLCEHYIDKIVFK